MRLALVIAAPYEQMRTLPALSGFERGAHAVSDRLRQPDSDFSVQQIVADVDFPERLRRLLETMDSAQDPLRELVIYYSGYCGITGDGAPALLLDGEAATALPLEFAIKAADERADSVLILIDGVLGCTLPGVELEQAPGVLAERMRQSLEGAGLSGFVAASPWGHQGQEQLAFTRRLLETIELLERSRNRDTRVTAAWIREALQQREDHRTSGTACHVTPSDFCLLPAPRELNKLSGPPSLPASSTDPAGVGQTGSGRGAPLPTRERMFAPENGGDARTPPAPANHASEANSIHRRGALPSFADADVVAALPKFTDSLSFEAELGVPPKQPGDAAALASLNASPDEADDSDRITPQSPISPEAATPQGGSSLGPPALYAQHDQPETLALPDSSELAPSGTGASSVDLPLTEPVRTDEPVSVGVLRQRAQQAIAHGDAQQAIDHLLEAESVTSTSDHIVLQVELARAYQAAGDVAQAVERLERALELDPTNEEVFNQLVVLMLERHDFEGADAAYAPRIASLNPGPERSKLHRARIEMWQNGAHDLERARTATQSWLDDDLEDLEALRKLVDLCDSLEDYSAAVEARTRLASMVTDQSLKASILCEAAELASSRVLDSTQAVELAALALTHDASNRLALRLVAAHLKDNGEWAQLAAVYEQVLHATLDPEAALALGQELGQLYLQKLKDPFRAAAAMERVLVLNPQNTGLRCQLADLYAEHGTKDRAFRHIRLALTHRPNDEALYRRAHALATSLDDLDGAWQACAALKLLGQATRPEIEFADGHRQRGLLAATRVLTDSDWHHAGLFPEHDLVLDQVLTAASQHAIPIKLAWLKKQKQLPELNPEHQQDPETSTTTLARTLVWTSRLLGIRTPDLFIEDPLPSPIVKSLIERPTVVVSRELGRGVALPELAFLWARQLLHFRPEYAFTVFFPTARALEGLAAAALAAMGFGDGNQLSGEALFLFKKLKRRLPTETREQLKACVGNSPVLHNGQFAPAVIEQWQSALLVGAGRVGLLACGDLETAVNLTQRFPQTGIVSDHQQWYDLLAFAQSRAHGELRERLGVKLKAAH